MNVGNIRLYGHAYFPMKRSGVIALWYYSRQCCPIKIYILRDCKFYYFLIISVSFYFTQYYNFDIFFWNWVFKVIVYYTLIAQLNSATFHELRSYIWPVATILSTIGFGILGAEFWVIILQEHLFIGLNTLEI